MSELRRVVVKVGGSLYDLPDLGRRLATWLRTLAPAQVLLVPGGGAAADVIRDLDRRFQLGDVAAHDLALRAMSLNAAFLSMLLACPRSGPLLVCNPLVGWPADSLVLLDAHAFCAGEAGQSVTRLPATWHVTSDTVAAWAALVLEADELVLLKSVTLPVPCDWEAASASGHVDPLFPPLARQLRCVRVVNLRTLDLERSG